MRILTTFPGRAGDLLWALPTVRAISEAVGAPVDLQVAGEFEGLRPLLELQPYLRGVYCLVDWSLDQHGWQPPALPVGPHDQVIHLGYRRWPEAPLPREVWNQTVLNAALVGIRLGELDLRRPWITVPPAPPDMETANLAAGFTDCWFELKLGVVECLKQVDIPQLENGAQLCPAGSRWDTEAGYSPSTWLESAQVIAAADLFLGDCSALHVLACALGKPCVLVEPMEARWNPIFYPYGMDGPQVRVVKGLDGRPTFDARHTAETLREVLGAR